MLTVNEQALPEERIMREFRHDVFSRVTGASLRERVGVHLLIDATENYPAWMDAIESATDRIYFESYIIHGDAQGKLFADALIAKAKDGVDVKVIYDWLGGFGKTSWLYWRRLRENGVEVRCYNPPKLRDPLGVFSRDHRKSLIIDGRIAFVSGLCVGQDWAGYPERGVPPWRDTGVQLSGPAVADVEDAFAEVWASMGTPLIRGDMPLHEDESGDSRVRVIQSSPGEAHVYRLDQILASAAVETMWITDAYFVGVPSYLQAMKDASHDGVDVRVLVPRSTDIALVGDTTRSTYRSLLEAGVRVFEWNGPMVHAKTAVFDGRFSRVGSTNLNIASWFANYELDVFVECENFGREMQEMFLDDLENSTEIVLANTYRVPRKMRPRKAPRSERAGGSVRKATAGALNAATSIGSAIAKRSKLGPAESRLLMITSAVLLGLAVLFIAFPRAASIPIIAILLILAIPTLVKAIQNYRSN